MPPLFFKNTYIGFSIDPDGDYHGIQITVFSFQKGIGKRSLKNALLEIPDIEKLVKTKKEGYESREVFSHEAKGLGFYFAEILEDDRPLYREPVRYKLRAPHLGLGQAEWMSYIRRFIKRVKKVFSR